MATPAVTQVSPNSGLQGQTLAVNITGSGTHFAQGTTVASFGTGVTVNSLVVNSPLSATAYVTVGAAAAFAANTVTMTTGGEVATLAGGFTITAAPVQLQAFNNVALAAGAPTNLVDAWQGHCNYTFLATAAGAYIKGAPNLAAADPGTFPLPANIPVTVRVWGPSGIWVLSTAAGNLGVLVTPTNA